jgi:hypothetical protein
MKVSMVKDALAMAHKNCIFNHSSIIHQRFNKNRGLRSVWGVIYRW